MDRLTATVRWYRSLPTKATNSAEDYPVLRYAEVLLTYAEAHIMTTGWDEK